MINSCPTFTGRLTYGMPASPWPLWKSGMISLGIVKGRTGPTRRKKTFLVQGTKKWGRKESCKVTARARPDNIHPIQYSQTTEDAAWRVHHYLVRTWSGKKKLSAVVLWVMRFLRFSWGTPQRLFFFAGRGGGGGHHCWRTVHGSEGIPAVALVK